ncbi:MAG TPA: MazG nucleotide pyrophosphohydrolase domain-containing protein [Polyangiaceae bacterium]|nr:MazG nucleotide pyrophosphohydrolase domain-containing protein [Polyangiaceae bacterium]
MTEPPMTLAGFQELIRDRYLEHDRKRGTPGTFMWFIEEVGELSTALQKAAGHGANTSGGENLEEEFADVLAWLCTLANIEGVDLERAVRKKYCVDSPPTDRK